MGQDPSENLSPPVPLARESADVRSGGTRRARPDISDLARLPATPNTLLFGYKDLSEKCTGRPKCMFY